MKMTPDGINRVPVNKNKIFRGNLPPHHHYVFRVHGSLLYRLNRFVYEFTVSGKRKKKKRHVHTEQIRLFYL